MWRATVLPIAGCPNIGVGTSEGANLALAFAPTESLSGSRRFKEQSRAEKLTGLMSAFGPKRTSLVAPPMSAFGGKADITLMPQNVRLSPEAKIAIAL